jgi:hypothetical protein
MSVTTKGFKELEKAFNNSPDVVLRNGRNFFTRAMAAYKSGIRNKPWRVGGSGGGSPVASGALRDGHTVVFKPYEATIGPSGASMQYAPFVHEGTRHMTARPWLDAVKIEKQSVIDGYADKMLEDITKDLAR